MLLLWVVNNPLQTTILISGIYLILATIVSKWNQALLKKPSNDSYVFHTRAVVLAPFLTLKARFDAWSFLVHGPAIIQSSYEKSNNRPFTVHTPGNSIVLVSDWKHIKEVDAAPEGTLSLLAAAKEVLQPKHTMSNFNWTDKRGSDGAPLQMTLRSRLSGHLPNLLPAIRHDLSDLFLQRFDSFSNHEGYKRGAIFPIILEAVAKSNAHALFGPELSRDARFLEAGTKMIEQTLIIAEILRAFPSVFTNPLGKLLSKFLNSGTVMVDTLTNVVSQRFKEREARAKGHNIPQRNDCIEWIMDHSPRHKPWGITRVVHELVAVWFGSVHIASTTACVALFDLCDHPEYVDILRHEIRRTSWETFDQSSGQIFPLLDSFLKESARLHPIESVSTRRKVLKPFSLSDGTTLEPGQWICSAPRGMNTNPTSWFKASEFYGFRFVQPEVLEQTQRDMKDVDWSSSNERLTIPELGRSSAYTDLTDWQQWGTGKASCTGRWYASAAIKIMIGVLITQYDIKLVDPEADRYFFWRTFMYPYASTQIAIKHRV